MFIETYKDSEVVTAIGELVKVSSFTCGCVRRSELDKILEEIRKAVTFHQTCESKPPAGAEVIVRFLELGHPYYAVARFRDGNYHLNSDDSVLNATHWKYVNHIS